LFEVTYVRLALGNISIQTFFDDLTSLAIISNDDGVIEYPSINALVASGSVRDARKLLRLIASRSEQRVPALDLRNIRYTGVIAARKVIFDDHTSVVIGSSNLVIIAEELVIEDTPDVERASILAYSPDDLPPQTRTAPGSSGVDGLSAGSVTIIILGRTEGSGRLIIDLRGQQGGTGVDGSQHDPPPQAADRLPSPGRPRWSYRTPHSSELHSFQELVVRSLARSDLDDESKDRIRQTGSSLAACASDSGLCKLLLCDEENWAIESRGNTGEKGGDGGDGGKGGRPGNAGQLEIYSLDTQAVKTNYFQWLGGHRVDSVPPKGLVGDGGQPGRGASGGLGGLGLAGDPFGICPRGLAGENGPPGNPGRKGSPGDPERHPGVRATFASLGGLEY
jgi:hypothetical protein